MSDCRPEDRGSIPEASTDSPLRHHVQTEQAVSLQPGT
jgi:hypothetical protein